MHTLYKNIARTVLLIMVVFLHVHVFTVSADSCVIDVWWRAPDGKDYTILPKDANVGEVYGIFARFTNCAGFGEVAIGKDGSTTAVPKVLASGSLNAAGQVFLSKSYTFEAPGSYFIRAYQRPAPNGTLISYKDVAGSARVVGAAINTDNCKVQAYWKDEKGNKTETLSNAVTGKSYGAYGVFDKCSGTGNVVLRKIGGSANGFTLKIGALNKTSDQVIGRTFTFDTPGTYYLLAIIPRTSAEEETNLNHQDTTGNVNVVRPSGGNVEDDSEGGDGEGSGDEESGGRVGGVDQISQPVPFNNLLELALYLMRWSVIVIGLVATVMVIVGGFRMVTSRGNGEQFTKAKQTVIYALGGVVLTLMSYSIIAAVQNLLRIQ